MSDRTKSRLITAGDQWTDWITSSDGPATFHFQNAGGDHDNSVTVQMRPQFDVGDVEWPDDDAGAVDIKTYTAPTNPGTDDVNVNTTGGGQSYRIGIKADDFEGGAAKVWVSVRNAFSS